MTVSLWQRSERLGVQDADLVVVGAGICGLSAALHAQRRGLRVRVVERHRLGAGASGRNAGFLMRGCADNYADAVRAYGRTHAAELWRLTERNLQGLRAEGVGSLPGTRDVPSVLLALEEGELAKVRESLTMLREDGFDAAWIEKGRDAAWANSGALGGLVNPGDASCHSLQVLRLLAGKLERPVEEGQEVVEIGESGSGLRVRVTDGEFRTPRALVCTNAYAPLLLPELEGGVEPRRGQMIFVRAHGVRLDASYYANHGSEYFRQTPDGTIVVGGCRTYHADREVGYDDRVTPWVQTDIEAFARRVLGSGFEVQGRWSGVMGFTKNHLPIIAPVCRAWDRGGRVWFCGGFTGHGMSMAYETSRLAVGAMLDGSPTGFEGGAGGI